MCAEVRPGLQRRIAEEYSTDPDFTSTWDELQREARCCGVAGPRDFLALIPAGAAGNQSTFIPPGGSGSSQWWWWRREGEDLVVVPDSCCKTVPASSTTSNLMTRRVNETLSRDELSTTTNTPLRCEVYPVGCEEHLLIWLRKSADTLFVLGYCVVAFIKLTFLGILRYEIREMIQKIKVLQSERADLAAAELALTTGSPTLSTTTPIHHMNHLGPPDRAPLLQRCSECNPSVLCSPPVLTKLGNHTVPSNNQNIHHHHQHNTALVNGPTSLLANNDGNDSDTNSHCALIVVDKPGSNGNNNELHELQEMRLMARQTQI